MVSLPNLAYGDDDFLDSFYIHDCKVNDIDLSSMPPKEFDLKQDWINHNQHEEYTWVIGFCSKVVEAPAGNDECTQQEGAGFLQQYSSNKCQADFNIWHGIRAIDNGVIISVAQDAADHYKIADITLICDENGKPGEAHHSGLMKAVNVTDSPNNNGTLYYSLVMKSKCACPGGCEHVEQHSQPLPAVLPTTGQKHQCKAHQVDLSSLAPHSFTAKQVAEVNKTEDYHWVFGFCSGVGTDQVPDGKDPCPWSDGAGYLQQYSVGPNGKCEADFQDWVDVTHLGGKEQGLKIIVRTEGRHHTKVAEVKVLCKTTAENVEGPENNFVMVETSGEVLKYSFTLYHKCACEKYCINTAPPHRPTAPSVIHGAPTPRPGDSSPYTDDLYYDGVYDDYNFEIIDRELDETEQKRCKLEGRDLSMLPLYEFVAKQNWITNPNHPANHDYTWTIGWCTPVWRGPLDSTDPCTSSEGAGYLQQYGKGKCAADFTQWKSIGIEGNSVKIVLEDHETLPSGQPKRRVTVYVACEPSMAPGEVVEDDDHVDVTGNSTLGEVLEYSMNFKSKCACSGGCDTTKMCRIGDRDFSHLRSHENEFLLKDSSRQTYSWNVGFCKEATPGTVFTDPCGAGGWVHQFKGNKCVHNFNRDFTMYEHPDGVVFQSTSSDSKIVARVVMHCDPNADPYEVHHKGGEEVTVLTDERLLKQIYTIRYRSKCACDGGCSLDGYHEPTPNDDQPAEPMPNYYDVNETQNCKFGNIDLKTLPRAWETVLTQKGPDAHQEEDYVWLFGFCRKVLVAPTGRTPCTTEQGAGWLQQFKMGSGNKNASCAVDFNEGYSIGSIPGKSDGVQFTLQSVPRDVKRSFKTVHINVFCNPWTRKSTVRARDETVKVESTTSAAKRKTNTYTINLESPCVCATGCDVEPGSDDGDEYDYKDDEVAEPVIACTADHADGTIDLRSLEPYQFVANERRRGRKDVEWDYLIGWCTPQLEAPSGNDPCGDEFGLGLFHQFSGSRQGGKWMCYRHMDTLDSFEPISTVINGVSLPGVMFVYKNIADRTYANVSVVCDPQMRANEVREDFDVVNVTDSGAIVTLQFRFRSLCACPGKCSPDSTDDAPVPEPVPEFKKHKGSCKAGGVDLGKVEPIQFIMGHHYVKADGKRHKEEYFWSLDFCNPIDPTKDKFANRFDACTSEGGPGYLQQFREDKCVADFNTGWELKLYKNPDNKAEHGVVLHLLDVEHGRHTKEALVYVLCDKKATATRTAMDEVAVKELNSTLVQFTLKFYHREACHAHSFLGSVFRLFAVVAVLYLVLGCIFNKFVLKKEGFEIIPNYAFWVAVPTLIVDAIFALKEKMAGRGEGWRPVSHADDEGDEPTAAGGGGDEGEDDEYL